MSLYKSIIIIPLLLVVTGCYFFKSTPTPIPTNHIKQLPQSAPHLVIFMPGVGDEPDAFDKAGFFDSHPKLVKFDRILVDSHLGYYRNNSIPVRIYTDILMPLKDQYEKITIVGTSLGGFGALWIADEYPDIIDQVVLIAPYLGEKETTDSVIKAGGISKWYSTIENFDEVPNADNTGEKTWQRIYRLINVHQSTLILAYGKQDDFVANFLLLEQVIEGKNRYVSEGGHKWDVWESLWTDIINSRDL